jgi:hypothetical protein
MRAGNPSILSHAFIVSPGKLMTKKCRVMAALIVLLARFSTAAAARTKAEATKPV